MESYAMDASQRVELLKQILEQVEADTNNASLEGLNETMIRKQLINELMPFLDPYSTETTNTTTASLPFGYLVYFTIVCTVALPLNGALTCIYGRQTFRHGSPIFNYLFVLHAAQFISVSCAAFTMLMWAEQIAEGAMDVSCKIVTYLAYIGGLLSPWIIAEFTVERFIAVRFPFIAHVYLTRSRSRRTVLFTIGFGVVYYFWILFAFGVQSKLNTTACDILPSLNAQFRIFDRINFLVVLCCPFALIAVLNGCIICTIIQGRRSLRNLNAVSRTSSKQLPKKRYDRRTYRIEDINDIIEVDLPQPRKNTIGSSVRNKKSSQASTNRINYHILALTCIFLVSNGPIYCLRFLTDICNISFSTVCTEVASGLYLAQFLVNCIVYARIPQQATTSTVASLVRPMRRSTGKVGCKGGGTS